MKRRTNTKIYAWLDEHGYLSRDKEAIAEGKRLYRKEYMKGYKKNYQKRHHTISLTCTPKQYHLIRGSAGLHRMKIAAFVLNSAIAYLQQQYLMPRAESIVEILQLLRRLRDDIEQVNTQKRSFLQKDRSEAVLELLEQISSQLRRTLTQPKNVATLVRDALNENPEWIYTLKKIVEEYDRKIKGT